MRTDQQERLATLLKGQARLSEDITPAGEAAYQQSWRKSPRFHRSKQHDRHPRRACPSGRFGDDTGSSHSLPRRDGREVASSAAAKSVHRSEARQRLDALISDKQWAANWTAGHRAEAAEYPGSLSSPTRPTRFQRTNDNTTPEPNLIETVSPGQLNSRDLASTVEMFRDSGLTDDVINQAMRGGEVSQARAEHMAAKALKSARLGDEAWSHAGSRAAGTKEREMLQINTIVSSFQEG